MMKNTVDHRQIKDVKISRLTLGAAQLGMRIDDRQADGCSQANEEHAHDGDQPPGSPPVTSDGFPHGC